MLDVRTHIVHTCMCHFSRSKNMRNIYEYSTNEVSTNEWTINEFKQIYFLVDPNGKNK